MGINSPIASQTTFAQVLGISNCVAMTTGGLIGRALTSDGKIYGCGDNYYRHLGDGTTIHRSTFVAMTNPL